MPPLCTSPRRGDVVFFFCFLCWYLGANAQWLSPALKR